VLYRNDEVLIRHVHKHDEYDDHHHHHEGHEDIEIEVEYHHHDHHSHGHDEHHGGHPTSGGVDGGIVVKKPLTVVIKEMTCYNFDQMITVSEETINRGYSSGSLFSRISWHSGIFASIWTSAKKHTHHDVIYRYEVDTLKVTFQQPRIQLLSGGRAIVWITIGSGKMIVDGHETVVGGWTMAIEVKLKMVEHQHLAVEHSFLDRFKSLFGTSQTARTYKHIVLDVDCECAFRFRVAPHR
jgi:hypothetical protein